MRVVRHYNCEILVLVKLSNTSYFYKRSVTQLTFFSFKEMTNFIGFVESEPGSDTLQEYERHSVDLSTYILLVFREYKFSSITITFYSVLPAQCRNSILKYATFIPSPTLLNSLTTSPHPLQTLTGAWKQAAVFYFSDLCNVLSATTVRNTPW
jgi:hypothetical protein